MINKDVTPKIDLSSIRRSAKVLREQLEHGDAAVKLTITGGRGGIRPDNGSTVAACVFDITSPTRDDANGHLNELAAQGCQCSGPTQTADGNWSVSCNCPDD
jgi:hypothetical protein